MLTINRNTSFSLYSWLLFFVVMFSSIALLSWLIYYNVVVSNFVSPGDGGVPTSGTTEQTAFGSIIPSTEVNSTSVEISEEEKKSLGTQGEVYDLNYDEHQIKFTLLSVHGTSETIVLDRQDTDILSQQINTSGSVADKTWVLTRTLLPAEVADLERARLVNFVSKNVTSGNNLLIIIEFKL